MARPKKPDFSNHAAIVERAFTKYGYEGIDEILRNRAETIAVPAGYELPKDMRMDWELIPQPDGTGLVRHSASYKLKVDLALLPYRLPQLKSTESREQVDYNITWTVKQFTINAAVAPELGKAIDAPQVRQITNPNDDGA